MRNGCPLSQFSVAGRIVGMYGGATIFPACPNNAHEWLVRENASTLNWRGLANGRADNISEGHWGEMRGGGCSHCAQR